MSMQEKKRRPRGAVLIEAVIFKVKWVLPIFYLGLAIILLMYGYSFCCEIVDVVIHQHGAAIDKMKIILLDFIDLVMVASLAKMIIAGSYNSFVTKDHGQPNENISSGMLKIKISTSILVVCSMDMLKHFVAGGMELQQKLCIYAAFLVAALTLGVLEYLHIKGEEIEKQTEEREAAHAHS